MEKLKRWVLRGLAGAALIAGVLAGVLFVLSERIIGEQFNSVERAITVPGDPDSIAEGGRLTRVRGCYDGCHGEGAGGANFFGIAVPNLTRVVHEYSARELEASIRQGIRPDGTSLFGMPSDAFSHLSDEDLGRIIAFLRSLPASNNDPGPRRFPAKIRLFLTYFTHWEGVEAHQAARTTKVPPPANAPNEPEAFGRYLAFSTCAECHGLDLFGQFGMPDLIVASAYTLDEFRHLMATGEAPQGRVLDLMAAMGRQRFSYLKDEEVDALYAFLTSGEFIGADRE